MSDYEYLAHHGIKGQKWGVRRFQFLDGTLTALGRLMADANKVGKPIDFHATEYANVSDEEFYDALDYLSDEKDFVLSLLDTEPAEGSPMYFALHPNEIDAYIARESAKNGGSPQERAKYEETLRGIIRERVVWISEMTEQYRKEEAKQKKVKKKRYLPHQQMPDKSFNSYNTVKPHFKKVRPGQVGATSGMNWSVKHSDMYLAHHGIKGQEWGVRRFQNEDGSLTPAGRERYGVGDPNKKYSRASVYGMEAKYQAGVAKKKATKYAKEAPARVVSKAKQTANELRRDRQEAKAASDKRKAAANAVKEQKRAEKEAAKREKYFQDKAKREAAAEARREKQKEKAEIRKQKAQEEAKRLIEKWQNKKSLSEVKAAMTEAKLRSIEAKFKAIEDQKALAYMKVRYAEEKKFAKRDAKEAERLAKKDTRDRFSNRDIRALSDEDLAKRHDRLKKEAEVRKLEMERAVPGPAKQLWDAMLGGTTQAVKSVAGDFLTKKGKEWLGLDETGGSTIKKQINDIKDELELRRQQAALANFDRDQTDDELKRVANRMQTQQQIRGYKDSNADYESDRALSSAQRESKRITAQKTIDAHNQAKVQNNANRNAAVSYKKAGVPVSEIAKRLGLTEDQVKYLLYSAR